MPYGTQNRKNTIFVDESGDPGLRRVQITRKPYFVFSQSPIELEKRLKTVEKIA